MDEYYKWLVEADDGKPHRRTPTLKEIWQAGDLKPKLEAWNKDIECVLTRWRVRNVPPPETTVHRSDRIKSIFGGSHSSRIRVRKC